MKRLIFVLITVLLLLCGCEESEVCEKGDYWEIIKNTSGDKVSYDYIIYDEEGNAALEGHSNIKPRIVFDEYSYTCIYTGDNSEYSVQFVRPYDGRVSEVFENPLAWNNGRVAVVSTDEEGRTLISVRSSFSDWNFPGYELPLSTAMQPKDAILGAAFDECAETLTVIYISDDNNRCAAVLPLYILDWENNPIDSFYQKYKILTYDTVSDRVAAYAYREAWKTEFDNAYQLLRGMANPKIDEIQTDIDTAVDSFEKYTEAYANVYKTYGWSNGFFNDERSEWDDSVFYGTGATGAGLYFEGDLYRDAALSLYHMMNDRFSSVDEAFVFDEQEYLRKLSEAGISVAKKD